MDKEAKINLASRIIVVAGTITVFTAVLLLLNFFQLKLNPPLDSPAQETLIKLLEQQPNNDELREQIRTIDLMARKAFFTKEWQIRTGSYILLIFAVITLIALRYYFSEKEVKEIPSEKPLSLLTERVISRKWIMAAIALVFVSAAATAFISQSDYKISKSQITDSDKPIDETQIAEQRITKTKTDTSDFTLETDSLAVDSLGTGKTEGDDEENYPGLHTIRRQHNAFRGALGQGVVYVENTPQDWEAESGKNILWKIPVPQKGYNSPIIWGGRLFFTGGDNNSRTVYCYNRNNGILIWKHEVKDIPGSPATPPRTTDDTGLAAPTMTTDGIRVYAIFGTGDIIALDLEGNRIWAKNLGVPDNHYGHSSSLLTWEGKLFVQYDTNQSGMAYILDAKTGDTRTQIRRNVDISWSSPILANIGGKYQLIMSSKPDVIGYDIETGRELWKVNCMMGEVGPAPTYYSGLIFAVNEYAKLVAIDPGAGYSVKWESNEYLSEVSSPVGANGLLFVPTSYGVLACYDAQTGELIWEHDFYDGFYSSPIAVGNKIYLFDLGGNGHIVEASRTFNKIASSPLGEEVHATPAFADGKMYVRGLKHLFCIGENQ